MSSKKVITRTKSCYDNLCDYCDRCYASCEGEITFNEEDAGSDNVIGCDSFEGTFDPEWLVREECENSD